MSQQVILEEGGYVNVHKRIKDMCRESRNRLGYTNQDISNKISDRFGIEDFSVNTVNNFFSERSKATTIYTTGYICAVLDISIDAVFGIERKFSSQKEEDYIRDLAELKVALRFREQEIEHLKQTIDEKDARISQAQEAIVHYRKEADANSRKVQPWVFTLILILLICSLVFIAVYLICIDLNNPAYGLIRSQMAAMIP